ncbi:hypothetical protein Bbelb_395820 [Branchiostoma belcheri]|nr:hypothetical protein Bbelb_395820 [Branchiostoma belcheri]
MGKLSMILLPVLVIAAAARAPAEHERSKTWSQPGDILPDWSMARLRYDGCSADSAGRAGTFKDLVTTGRHSPRLVNGTTSLRRLQSAGPTADAFHDSTAILMDGDIRWLIRRGHRPMMLEWQKPHGDYITTHGDYIITGGVANPVLY